MNRLLKSEAPSFRNLIPWNILNGNCFNIWMIPTTSASGRSQRACRPLFTDSKPFRLLDFFFEYLCLTFGGTSGTQPSACRKSSPAAIFSARTGFHCTFGAVKTCSGGLAVGGLRPSDTSHGVYRQFAGTHPFCLLNIDFKSHILHVPAVLHLLVIIRIGGHGVRNADLHDVVLKRNAFTHDPRLADALLNHAG